MTDKHTPGPWIFRKDECWTIFADGQSIMGDERYYPWCPSNESDWQLIAAAPDLLAACELIVSAFDALKPTSAARYEPLQINAARRAIAKATGVLWPDAL